MRISLQAINHRISPALPKIPTSISNSIKYGIEPEKLAQLQEGLASPRDRWEHIGVYNVAARLQLLDKRCRFVIRSRPGFGTAVSIYLPLVEIVEEEFEDDTPADRR